MGCISRHDETSSLRTATIVPEAAILRGKHVCEWITIARKGTPSTSAALEAQPRVLGFAVFGRRAARDRARTSSRPGTVLNCRHNVPNLWREPTVPTEQQTLFARLTSHIPPAQFSRYTLVGIWNTIFGYGSYAALTALLMPRMTHGYLVAAVLSSLVSISVAFLGYKWLVFKTRGNYLREWLRCHVVYGTAALIGIIVLPAFVYGYHRLVGLEASAPYVAGATVTGLNVIVSFLGHRHFSFRRN